MTLSVSAYVALGAFSAFSCDSDVTPSFLAFREQQTNLNSSWTKNSAGRGDSNPTEVRYSSWQVRPSSLQDTWTM